MIIPELRRFGEGRTLRMRRVRAWEVWNLPITARVWLTGVDLIAVAALTMAAVGVASTSDALKGTLLIALALGYGQLVRRIQGLRNYLAAASDTPVPMPLSVWSFAAVVALPLPWAVAVSAALHIQEYVHTRRDRAGTPYRVVFAGAAAVVAQVVTAQLVVLVGSDRSSASAVLALAAFALLYTTLNLAILVTGMALASGRRVSRAMLPDADAVGYDLSCLAMGLCLGELLLHSPWAAPVLAGPVVYLQRSAMIKELRQATRVDAKTGVLNATAWRQHATTSLDRCAQRRAAAAVFVVDIDDFKRINDTFGHLVGDRVLDRVTATMRAAVRSADAIGRFGGDEFVLIVDGVDFATAHEIGERMRQSAAEIDVDGARVSVSVGLAHISGDRLPVPLDELITRADEALYRAKTSGRDRLCIA